MDAVALSLQLVQTADKIWTFLKNVKNAPEDLQRISDTVESLRTISKNVHTVLISQQPQVVQDQQDPVPAPRPLPGIEACLRKCEEQLRPLEDIVNKHSAAFRNDSPKLDKLWSSIRMGFKSKDIADFHTRVHREMDFLKLWLELNSYHYNAQILPDIRRDIRSMQESFLMAIKTTMTQVVPVNQGTCPAPNVGPASSSDTYSYSQDIDLYAPSHRTTVDVAPHRRSTQLLVKVHSIDMPLIIRCLGLRGKKVRKYLQFEQRDEENINSERPVIISEEVVYSWEFHNLRRGVELHFDSLHSAILPAVSSYPVMQGSMLRLCRDIFATGTLKDLQTAFSSGKLHPFTRNVDGYTLLHLAARYCRADFCQLLVALGCTVEMCRRSQSDPIRSPAWSACIYSVPDEYQRIDTLRFLLQNDDAFDIEHFEPRFWTWEFDPEVDRYRSGPFAQWLWDNAPLYFDDSQVSTVRCELFNEMLSDKNYGILILNRTQLLEVLDKSDTLYFLFDGGYTEADSCFAIGKDWIDFLLKNKVDLEDYFKKEIARAKECASDSASNELAHWPDERPRRVVIGTNSAGEWNLGWQWVVDSAEPCFLVCSEFAALANNIGYEIEWPYSCGGQVFFFEFEHEDNGIYEGATAIRRTSILKRAERFNRRMANKAQKESRKARKGLPRRMPGAWI